MGQIITKHDVMQLLAKISYVTSSSKRTYCTPAEVLASCYGAIQALADRLDDIAGWEQQPRKGSLEWTIAGLKELLHEERHPESLEHGQVLSDAIRRLGGQPTHLGEGCEP